MSSSSSSLHELNPCLNDGFNSFFVLLEEIDNFNVLSRWKSQEHIYPILVSMVGDLQTPLMSTVALESCFSV